MAKRFTDTNKWDKLWFRKLPPAYKCLWDYLFTKCDHAGIYDVDLGLASFVIGHEFEEKKVLDIFKDQLQQIKPNKWFLRKFIQFQYGELSDQCKPHIAVIKRLNQYNIKYAKGLETLKDKDKVKVKVKKSVEERAKIFAKEVSAYIVDKKIDVEEETMLDFYNYWIESNKHGTMRFEMEKVFDIGRRLGTWKKNTKQFNKFDNNQTSTIDNFKFDSTGKAVIGYCEKCLKSDFYNPKYVLNSDSKCCSGKILPKREKN